jgi:hypothetical protein
MTLASAAGGLSDLQWPSNEPGMKNKGWQLMKQKSGTMQKKKSLRGKGIVLS